MQRDGKPTAALRETLDVNPTIAHRVGTNSLNNLI